MKRTILLTLFVASLFASATLSLAHDVTQDGKSVKPAAQKIVLPDGITEEMLAPPPVPAFMLEKPAKPLTVLEMLQQAREAEKKAGVKRATVVEGAKEPAPKP